MPDQPDTTPARTGRISNGHDALDHLLTAPLPTEGQAQADWIRSARRALDLTQVEFAEQIGVSKGLVERWEGCATRVKKPYLFLVISLLRDEARKQAEEAERKAERMAGLAEGGER
jgi:DNA-binding transcriptional regulator YiaG